MPLRLIWWTTWLMLLGMAVTPFFYFGAMADDPVVESTMSPDADSWGIPMFGSFFLVLLASPVILSVTYACTRRYAKPHLFVFQRDRLVRSTIVTAAAAAILVPVLGLWISDFVSSPPAYEYDWVPSVVLGALWVAMLRAAMVSKYDRPAVQSNDSAV